MIQQNMATRGSYVHNSMVTFQGHELTIYSQLPALKNSFDFCCKKTTENKEQRTYLNL